MKFIDPDGMDGILWSPKPAEVLPEVTPEPLGASAPARVLMGGAVVGLVAAGLSFGLAAWWSAGSRAPAAVEREAAATVAVAQVAPAPQAVAAMAAPAAPVAPAAAAVVKEAAPADAAVSEAAASAAAEGAAAQAAAAKEAAAQAAAAKEAAAQAAAAKEAAAQAAAAKETAAKDAAAKEAAAKDAAAKAAAAKQAAAKAAPPAATGGVLGSARFGWDSAVLSASSAAAVVKAAGSCSGTLVISGHTCDIGDPAYNVDLSRRRAAAVAAALAAAGVPQSRLDVRGEGAAAPSGSGARRDSRRVDITCVGGSR
jgi:outer membrane protein OmpA-like peptidoglycan-associated protein